MTPSLSLGPRTPDTVIELSVYNTMAHVQRMDMTCSQLSQWLCANWHTRGPRTPEPTVDAVREAAQRLALKGHVSLEPGDMVKVRVRQGAHRGLPLFVERVKR